MSSKMLAFDHPNYYIQDGDRIIRRTEAPNATINEQEELLKVLTIFLHTDLHIYINTILLPLNIHFYTTLYSNFYLPLKAIASYIEAYIIEQDFVSIPLNDDGMLIFIICFTTKHSLIYLYRSRD